MFAKPLSLRAHRPTAQERAECRSRASTYDVTSEFAAVVRREPDYDAVALTCALDWAHDNPDRVTAVTLRAAYNRVHLSDLS